MDSLQMKKGANKDMSAFCRRAARTLQQLYAVLCGLAVLNSGCLSYRTGGLPDSVLSTENVHTANKPTVYVEVRCQTQSFNETSPGKNVAAAQNYRGAVSRVFEASAPFKAYTFMASRGKDADCKLVLDFNCVEKASLANLLFTCATFSVIPATSTTTFKLTSQFYDGAGKKVEEYEVEDSMRLWIELFLLPLGPWKSPVKVEERLIENLVRTTLTRMNADGLLRVPPS